MLSNRLLQRTVHHSRHRGRGDAAEVIFEKFLQDIGKNNAYALRTVELDIGVLDGSVKEKLHQQLFVKPLSSLRQIAIALPRCAIAASVRSGITGSRVYREVRDFDMQDFGEPWLEIESWYEHASARAAQYGRIGRSQELATALKRFRECKEVLRQIV